MRRFENKDVEEKFLIFPDDSKNYLFRLRDLIFDVAEADNRIGSLSEELRWGDPSYITAKTNAGSTVRLGLFGRSKVALLFNCKTTLVENFKMTYSDTLEYSKNRAILILSRRQMTTYSKTVWWHHFFISSILLKKDRLVCHETKLFWKFCHFHHSSLVLYF